MGRQVGVWRMTCLEGKVGGTSTIIRQPGPDRSFFQKSAWRRLLRSADGRPSPGKCGALPRKTSESQAHTLLRETKGTMTPARTSVAHTTGIVIADWQDTVAPTSASGHPCMGGETGQPSWKELRQVRVSLFLVLLIVAMLPFFQVF